MFKRFMCIMTTLALSLNLAVSFTPKLTSTASASRRLQLSQSRAEGDLNDFHCNKKQHSRRHAITTAIIYFSAIAPTVQAKVIGSGRCANGEGEGCDNLAEGNAYIQSLQKKSMENKEENQRVSLLLHCFYYIFKGNSEPHDLLLKFTRRDLTGSTLLILHEELPRCICCI